jgi:hypothetical protein
VSGVSRVAVTGQIKIGRNIDYNQGSKKLDKALYDEKK